MPVCARQTGVKSASGAIHKFSGAENAVYSIQAEHIARTLTQACIIVKIVRCHTFHAVISSIWTNIAIKATGIACLIKGQALATNEHALAVLK